MNDPRGRINRRFPRTLDLFESIIERVAATEKQPASVVDNTRRRCTDIRQACIEIIRSRVYLNHPGFTETHLSDCAELTRRSDVPGHIVRSANALSIAVSAV